MNASRSTITYGFRKSKSFYQALQILQTRSHHPYREIPGPLRLPLIGNLHLFSKFGPYSLEKLYDAYMDLHITYGPIVRLDMGMPLVLLFEPKDISAMLNSGDKYPARPLFKALRHYRLVDRKGRYSCGGLVSENGPEWARLRSAINFMMNPSFSSLYFKSHEEIADDFVKRIGTIKDENGLIPNFLHEIFKFTQEAIGVVCFGTRLGVLDSLDSKLSKNITAYSHDLLEALADTLLQPEYWKLFKTPIYKKLMESNDYFHDLAENCIKRAETQLQQPQYNPNLEFLRRLIEERKLSSSDILLVMVELFSSGLDTTGSAIGFILYNLAKNPEVQEKLHKEIAEHSKKGWNKDSLESMPYLLACIKESFRLNPVTGGSARILSKNAVFSDYEVPAGVTCLGLHPVICRTERHFKQPLQFIPERWARDGNRRLAGIHPYCVLPFTHGVRRCVGQRFGEQEIRLCVLKVIEKFRVEYDGPDVGTKMRLSLIPDKPLNFKFIER